MRRKIVILIALMCVASIAYGYDVIKDERQDLQIDKVREALNAARTNVTLSILNVTNTITLPDGQVTEADLVVPETDGLNGKRTARQAFTTANLVIGSNSLASMDIPDNAIVDFGFIDVTTICSSTNASSTFTLSLVTEQDLYLTATGDVSAAITAIIPVGTAGTAVKTTAAANPWITVAVGNYTGGAGVVCVEYHVGD